METSACWCTPKERARQDRAKIGPRRASDNHRGLGNSSNQMGAGKTAYGGMMPQNPRGWGVGGRGRGAGERKNTVRSLSVQGGVQAALCGLIFTCN